MLTKEEAKEYWYEKQRVARQTMDGRKGCNGILIECAAKVLEDGLHPDFEFRARLDRTRELYHKLCQENEVVHIYANVSLPSSPYRPSLAS